MQRSAPCPPGFAMSDEHADVRSNDFFIVLPNVRSSGSFARQRFSAYLQTLSLAVDCAENIVIAVGEALANAVEHGHRNNGRR